jgi:hypothetical protein
MTKCERSTRGWRIMGYEEKIREDYCMSFIFRIVKLGGGGECRLEMRLRFTNQETVCI